MPRQLPAFASNEAYVTWVKNNPHVCWRNCDVIPCGRRRYELYNLNLCNMNDAPARFVFTVSGTNVPSGTATFSTSDQQFKRFPVTAEIDPEGETTANRPVIVPAHYCGAFTVVLEFDQPLPCDASIELDVYEVVPRTSGTPQHRLAGAQEAAEDLALLGGYTFLAAPIDS
ncbi:hypothetical protein C1I98_13790 [Spongiactinospora gelatinilytica]|uniref:Uncharacterized protein n=2 Tax=Spongiactinospora gelatinilytica TaxID=2666298 RepID=A0A2W2GGG5_9ACTN|nr:hypothetical protein C1I98_13790 [Spongiactinospora gelatinilytica]